MSTLNRNALVTASEAATLLPVTINLIGMWRLNGKLKPAGRRGRSWVYRFGEMADLEARMRRAAHAANNHRARSVQARSAQQRAA